MNFYTYVYIISIIISLTGGVDVWRRQKNISGFFFFLFVSLTSLWFTFYFIFFSGIEEKNILLYVSRIDFALGVCAVYSFIFFIGFFGKEWQRSMLIKLGVILLFFISVILFYTFTDFIIADLHFELIDGVYRESFGTTFFLHILFHSIFLLLLIPVSYFSLKKQQTLQKVRLKTILISASVLLILLLFFQLLLPYFGIWIFEKEIIFLFTIFVISIPLIIRRYYFPDFGYGIGKLITYITAFSSSILGVTFLDSFLSRYYALEEGYWSDDKKNLIVLVFLGIITFLFLARVGKFILNRESSTHALTDSIHNVKRDISRITEFEDLIKYIERKMGDIFGSNHATIEIQKPNQKTESFKALSDFFQLYPKEQVFINDLVFIDKFRVKTKKGDKLLLVSKDYFLVFPLHSMSGVHIGLFKMGKKRFGDFYTREEIDVLRDLSLFLETHMKYMRTYSSMQEMSLNLDKLVDEKTIEYNNLISRQKEFISLVSHEVRSPLSSLLFQADSLVSDLRGGARVIRKNLLEELEMLRAQLVRTSSLVAKIFAVEHHDMQQVNLFREKIHFPQFLAYELELFAAVHPHLELIQEIDEGVGFISLDKVQFQQVLGNLLDNALKFAKEDHPIIYCSLNQKGKKLILTIEDNGGGIGDMDPNTLFDKYTTGKSKNVGLGMGLYLCKKIVSMHGGKIMADNSERYSGARFIVTLNTPPIGISLS